VQGHRSGQKEKVHGPNCGRTEYIIKNGLPQIEKSKTEAWLTVGKKIAEIDG